MAQARTVLGMTGRGIATLATVDPIGDRGGTCCITQPSNVATSGAMPGDSGNTVASSAGSLSITVRRVSMLVPCLA